MKGSSCGEDCLITTDNFLAKRHNSTPLITVITVTFNAGEKLERTIQSVINQTLKDVEFIVIDGGSTDKTTDIIRKYENKITYWISEEDQGIFDAMNKGINISSGQWINFMNAGDCFIENETLARISPYLDRTCADIVYGNTVMKYDDNHKKLKLLPSRLRFDFGLPFCHQSVFTRANLCKETNFNIKYKIYADYDFFFSTLIMVLYFHS
jgi:glycosyltransferase involved in cell wall biosynthesis